MNTMHQEDEKLSYNSIHRYLVYLIPRKTSVPWVQTCFIYINMHNHAHINAQSASPLAHLISIDTGKVVKAGSIREFWKS